MKRKRQVRGLWKENCKGENEDYEDYEEHEVYEDEEEYEDEN